jgi:hypothetical protein
MKSGAVVLAVLLFAFPSFGAGVKVATIRSWGEPSYLDLKVLSELNSNWASYGSTPVTIDTSLHTVSSFTYDDLVATGADVLWLSNPGGSAKQFSESEQDAISQYLQQCHSILGTFMVFQGINDVDNRALAPLFGLKSDINYESHTGAHDSSTFNILSQSGLFNGISNPYVSSGNPYGFYPSDDGSWDSADLDGAQFLAKTSDNRGVITWYDAGPYRAVYVSEMIEYNIQPSRTDAQFLYNVFNTVPEPATALLFVLGGLALRRKR